MTSTTLANQDSTISIKQKLSISIEEEINDEFGLTTLQVKALVNNSNVNLDISSIILQVLGSYNDASLGRTEISGVLVADDIIVDELLFSSDGQVIDISDIRLDISNLKTSVSYFNSIITEISNNLFILDNSTVKIDIFNDLSSSHYSSSHYSLYNRVNDLSINFSNLENKINDISFIFDNFELSNNRILVKLSMDISNLLITSNDFSFSYLETLDNSDNFVLSLKQLNELLGTYNFATTQDLSSITVDISSSFEYVNEINQTFYEIMTQQPHKFRKSIPNPTQQSKSEIIINWNFDHLLADHSNNSVYKAHLSYPESNNIKLAQLPFIDKIQIDISGKFHDGSQSEWLNLSTLNIPSDICYNTNNYKTLTIAKPGNANYTINDVNNLLNNNNYFNLRVYGINNAINYPSIEERGLIYEFLRFEAATPPSAPSIMLDYANSSTELTITFYVTNTEKDISNSTAKIEFLDISYSLNESLRSSYLTFNPSDYNVQNTNEDYTNNLIEQNEQFSDNITDLFSGSNYNYQARVRNNLNDLSFSEYSDISLSNYTLLPSSGQNTNIDFSVDNSIKSYITNSDFDNNEVIYINLSDSNNKIVFEETNLQNFEVTNPTASVNDNYGYGKFLDTMPSNSALVTINVYVDDLSKQTIIYDNSFTRSNVINNYSHSYFVNNTLSIGDAIQLQAKKKGFRLKGSLNLNHITDSASIIDKIGVPRSTPYKLTFEYLRHSDVNGINSTIDHNIYIDDFSGIPVINTIDNSNVVTQLAYNMGIPSVKSFNLNMERNYSNINSEHLYILPSKKISKINPINNTSASQEKIISLNNIADIASNGSYYYNYNEFDSATNNYYNNLNYSTSLLSNNYNLSWNEIVYNLYSNYRTDGNTFTISHITNHFCDYNSFNKTNNKIINSKLDLTLINLYEIDNINELGNNIANLTLSQYNNHNNLVKDSTLLYINDKFQSNSTNIYPDLNSYNYNGINLNNIYNAGNISYDLTGNNTGINNDGYKFIVFKINKSSSQDYTFNNIEYSRINYDGKSYISIKSMLTGLFDINIINKIFDINDNDAIGFVKVTLQGTNAVRIGNLKKDFIPVGGDWLQYSSTPVSYNNTFLKAYGSQVENTSNGDFGIFINPTAVNDDLTLFIGLKNN